MKRLSHLFLPYKIRAMLLRRLYGETKSQRYHGGKDNFPQLEVVLRSNIILLCGILALFMSDEIGYYNKREPVAFFSFSFSQNIYMYIYPTR